MDKCPHCGSEDSYSYKVYGLVEHRVGLFGNPEMDEMVDLEQTRPWPIWARCYKCKRRIKLPTINTS